jgi:DsbC/DsbD-like thiol-disulfide interchange protein
MNRRSLLLSSLGVVACAPAHANTQPWSARLLQGGFDGTVWWAGFAVTLAENWKTYWRVPGDGGIAPQFTLTGNNIAAHEIFYPLPSRYEDVAGVTIGYKHEVVFPVALTPGDSATSMTVELKAFFGVCDEVCIPAQFDANLAFASGSSAAPDQATISRWRGKVPRLTPMPIVGKASVKTTGGKIELWLDKTEGVRDVFIEGKPAHYFGKPALMRDLAILPVAGAKTESDVRGSTLRLTLDTGQGPLEQIITVG